MALLRRRSHRHPGELRHPWPVDVSKGYMRNILKVYRISARTKPKPGARPL
eukprot:COSAG01_NODE_3177_length_6463_cov_3.333909_5_plen_51_part_00